MTITWAGLRPEGGRPTPEWRGLLARHLRESWLGGRPLLVEAYLEEVPELAEDGDGLQGLLFAEVEVWGAAWEPASGEPEPHGPGLFGARLHGRRLPAISSPPPGYADPLPLIDQFGRYNRHLLLGAGGMGSVYLAWDTWVERYVALKVVRLEELPDRTARGERLTRRQRFYREAQALAPLDHPHLLRLQHYGFHDAAAGVEESPEREPYLDLGYVPGPSLAIYARPWDVVRVSDTATTVDHHPGASAAHRPLPLRRLAEIIFLLARAMAYVHDRGSTHRDLKPSNIRFNRYGEPVIVDFGLAQLPLNLAAGEEPSRVPRGTPRYMAPEAFAGDHDFRSDVYALGLILFELLTGQVPLLGMNWVDTCDRRREHDVRFPAPSADPDTAALQRICERATRARPDRRFRTMHEFADELARFIASLTTPGATPPLPRPRRVWPVAASALVGVLFGSTPFLAGWISLPGAPAATVQSPEGAGTNAAQPAPAAPRTAIPYPAVVVAAKRHLDALPASARQSVRFLTVHHRNNVAAVGTDELEQYRAAGIDVAGTLVGKSELRVTPVPGTSGVLLAVSFQDHPAALAAWDLAIREGKYPYAVEFRGDGVSRELAAADADVRATTLAEVPIVRADWLASAATDPKLRSAWVGGGPSIDWPATVREVADRYGKELMTASTAAADLDLDSPAALVAAIRDHRLPAELFGNLTAEGPWVIRTNWERPQGGSTLSLFQRAVRVLSAGTPVRVTPQ